MYFTHEGSGLEWREERFRRLDLSGVRCLSGEELEGVGASINFKADPPHISGRYVRVPEGIAVLQICQACGGRDEALVRGNKTVDVQEFHTFTTRPNLFDRAWLLRHVGCSKRPESHQPLLSVQEFARTLEGAARKAIAAGTEIPDTIFILDRTGRAFAIHVSYSNLSEDLFRAREAIRAQRLDLVAAFTISGSPGQEQPAGSGMSKGPEEQSCDSPKPERHLAMVYVTPTFGRMALSRSRRKGGGAGPAPLSTLHFTRLAFAEPLLDTLLA